MLWVAQSETALMQTERANSKLPHLWISRRCRVPCSGSLSWGYLYVVGKGPSNGDDLHCVPYSSNPNLPMNASPAMYTVHLYLTMSGGSAKT